MSEPNQTWRFFSRLCTLFIPNEWLFWAGKTDEQKQAWREKVALCFIMLAANVGFLGFGGLIHILSCGGSGPPCGGGDVGNGNCSDGTCCSVHGFCGTSPDHCGFNRKLQFTNLFTTNDDGEPLDDDDIVGSFTDSISESVNHENPTCRALNTTMLVIMFIIVAILAVQCLCSLIYLLRFGRTCCKAVRGDKCKDAKVIVMVPCYNEGEDELQKTIESVRKESYPNENKLLLFVADGNVKGKNSDGKDNHGTTPVILSELLGYANKRTDLDPKYGPYSCDSTGFEPDNTGKKIPIDNRARIYHGTHESLNYMVIEKCGRPVKGDVGNRGKRDSQIMLIQLLNKIQHNRHKDLNELERAIHEALREMGFPLTSDRAVGESEGLDEVNYLMAVDADTRLSTDSITQMIYSMESKPKTLALCGETKVDNKNDSWVTKIQVFEYYTNHGLKKAFESVFGTVTCLPGCFTMYRLFDRRDPGQPPQPLFACDYVYDRYAKNDSEIETLHEKNLYKLGEDRMLTTLLLQKFSRMDLKYVPEAHCYTIVPDKFSVLLSQRRRWVNSTFHNMLYLLRVGLGGICCCSMKFVVILDMIGTLILPSSLLYVAIMVYNTIVGKSQLSMITLLVFGFSVFVQLIAPLLRFKFKYLWSAVIYYVIGVPVFYFILPIYSFWHLDDFSWGTTRQVASAPAADDSNKATTTDGLGEEV